MPLSAGGINAFISVFRAGQTLLNDVCVSGDVWDQYATVCVCKADDLKPINGPWPQEESQKGVAINLVFKTCNSNAK